MFLRFVAFLNTGSDDSTDNLIDKMYNRLPTISGVHPVLDQNRPLLCLWNILLSFLYSAFLATAVTILYASAFELYKINFALFVNEIHLGFLVQMSLLLLWDSWMKRASTAELHRIIEKNFFDYQEDLAETLKVLRADMKIQRTRYIICIILIGIATSSAVALVPTLNQFGTFDYNENVTSQINFNLLVPAGYPFLSNDTIAYLAENLFEILETIENRAKKMYIQRYGVSPNFKKLSLYNEKFLKCYNDCLIKNILHHQTIVRATNHVNNVFGFYVFIYYLTAAVDIAMSMLSTSSTKEFPGTTAGAVIMCLVEIGFVALFAHMGQKLTNLATELREVIYSTPWYYCDSGIKRTIRIFQLVTLEPLKFSFRGILHINYDSFSTVMNSAYSYYNLVNASNK